MHHFLNIFQLLSGRLVFHYLPDSLGVSLQTVDQLLVRRRHSSRQQLINPGLQPTSLIGQLANHSVPDGEALVAGFTVRELSLVAPGTLVTARAWKAFHAGALPCGSITLLAGYSSGVAVTSWNHQRKHKSSAFRLPVSTLNYIWGLIYDRSYFLELTGCSTTYCSFKTFLLTFLKLLSSFPRTWRVILWISCNFF